MFSKIVTAACAAALMVGLSGCDSGAKATAAAPAPATSPVSSPAGEAQIAWAASRSRSAREAAQAQFERNGADFGAGTLDDYVAQANAFAEKPPQGAERATRPNGDVLLYHPASNVFAVVTAEGEPRAMFKPRNGAAYWAEQKSRVRQQAQKSQEGQAG